MRLAGERVALVPVPHDIALAVVRHEDVSEVLAGHGLHAAPGWPHADSADALRPHAEYGGDGPAKGTFLITVDGEVIGDCGWRGGPDARGDAEIGYGLSPAARGRRLGTEAVGVLAAWVERQPGVRRVSAEVLIGNEPSRRLLTRLGFDAEDGSPPYVTYVRDAPTLDDIADSG